jgi:hypothetical protein
LRLVLGVLEVFFRLFHQRLMPKIDSPATPTTTITPNTNSQMSIFASTASISDFSIYRLFDDSALGYVALFLVMIGLASLVIPLLALLRIVRRRRARGRDSISE